MPIDFYGAHDRAMFALERKAMDPRVWERKGFELEEIETSFEFETHEEADLLLGFYFGDRGRDTGKLRFAFRVGLYFGRSRGSGS